jgi:hypothetical protein
MKPLDLDELVRRAAPYERWEAPLAPGLRLGALLSAGATAATLGLLAALEPAWETLRHPLWLALPPQLFDLIGWALTRRSALAGALVCYLVAIGCVAGLTGGLRRGAIIWQQLLVGLVALGATQGLALTALAALLLANLLLWLLLITLGLGLLAGALRLIFGRSE